MPLDGLLPPCADDAMMAQRADYATLIMIREAQHGTPLRALLVGAFDAAVADYFSSITTLPSLSPSALPLSALRHFFHYDIRHALDVAMLMPLALFV